MEPCWPGAGELVVGWGVAGAKVEEGNFVRGAGRVWRGVYQRASWQVRGYAGVGENGREREVVGGDVVMGV